ncbi:MAG: hypothetical protein WCD18_12930 [Thermosynechococcaceae cyanobacterium]
MSGTLKTLISGRVIQLKRKLASSGEGTVWTTNFSGFLAKLYHTPNVDRIEKLKVMIAHPPQDPMRQHRHLTFAWPQDLLQNEQGQCIGFLMPEIMDGVKLSIVYNPKLRSRKAPRFNWYYLHTAAFNFALALKSLHEEGYVVGDIKPQNLLVNNRALVSIIDTDSFQVRDPLTQTIYRCLVGSEGFTPAELLGKELATQDQTDIHDRFRLGVMVYLLLFGDQPFKGKWIGRGESPLPTELIRQGAWPYAPNSLVQPGPNTIPLSILHPQLQVCFQRCFTEGHKNPQARPSAADWSNALKAAIVDLQMCHLETNHYYSRVYSRCYWCDRRSALGIDIFSPIPAAQRPTTLSPRRTTTIPRRAVALTKPTHSRIQWSPHPGTFQGMPTLKSTPALFKSKRQSLPPIQNLFHSRWSHPVLWGTGCIAIGLMGLVALLLPDLNFEAVSKNTIDLEAALEQWLRPSDPSSALVNPDAARATDQLQHGGHWDNITALDISSDDQVLISGSKDMTVKVWAFPTGQLLHTFADLYEPIVSVGISDNRQTVITSGLSGKILTWNLKTAELIPTRFANTNWTGEGMIRAAATDRQGQLVASSGWGGSILVQNLQSGKTVTIPSTAMAPEQALAVLPNAQTIISSDSDGKFQIWDATTGKRLRTFPARSYGEFTEPISTLTMSRNGRWIASGGWYGSISLWDVTSGTLIRTFPKQSKAISAIALSDRADRIATVSNDSIVKLWNTQSGSLISVLKAHKNTITALKFSHTGQFLVSGSDDPSIKIWNLTTRQVIKTLVQ